MYRQAEVSFGSDGSGDLSGGCRREEGNILATVRRALDRRDVLLAYQPVVDARRPDRPAFFEGLLRVIDDTGRIIPAGQFIEPCERLPMGRMLDCLALEKGLEALSAAPDLRLAINLSPRSIGHPRWLSTLEAGLAGAPTIAERLIVEITESSPILLPAETRAFMADLRRRGISFALDDFGAGHASFLHLSRFEFDFLKITGELTTGIHRNRTNQVLVQALVSVAGQFEMMTVAEAVEEAEEARCLSGIGIDCLQGYHFGMPTIRPQWSDCPAAMRNAG
ncbi:EAL domain-containing protein [Tropicimonas sp.]|uniref:EAL domain-containing protein n=1 Tax=Tropicimonas sp. TaxID=2067044 RepID=UPI003A84F207